MSFLRRRTHAPPAVRTPRQRAGDAAEAAACAKLEAAGCRILGRNVRYREGEIDIVADDDGTLVFVEVRMRRSDGFGGAGASIDVSKRRAGWCERRSTSCCSTTAAARACRPAGSTYSPPTATASATGSAMRSPPTDLNVEK